jgi:glutathione peroxidase
MKSYRTLLAGVVALALTSTYLPSAFMQSNLIAEEAKEAGPALAFSMKNINGESVDLKKYAGKVVVFVNVASQCGYTKQYDGLQKIYDQYKDKGLAIIGVPCNQFGKQEPGSNKEILAFCSSKYNVTFDMMEKVAVNTAGSDKACELYQYLTSQDASPAGKGNVKWNFEKFVVGRDGKVVARFASKDAPDGKEFVAAIESALAAK